jgi:hypothetical protein
VVLYRSRPCLIGGEKETVKLKPIQSGVRAWQLAAICLQVGRPKDHDRLLRFVEVGVLDAASSEGILARHGLLNAGRSFQKRYFDA